MRFYIPTIAFFETLNPPQPEDLNSEYFLNANLCNFTGIVMYYDLYDQFVKIEKYEEGVVTANVERSSFDGTDKEFEEEIVKLYGYYLNMGRSMTEAEWELIKSMHGL